MVPPCRIMSACAPPLPPPHAKTSPPTANGNTKAPIQRDKLRFAVAALATCPLKEPIAVSYWSIHAQHQTTSSQEVRLNAMGRLRRSSRDFWCTQQPLVVRENPRRNYRRCVASPPRSSHWLAV